MKLFAKLEGRFEYHDVFVTRRKWFAIEGAEYFTLQISFCDKRLHGCWFTATMESECGNHVSHSCQLHPSAGRDAWEHL